MTVALNLNIITVVPLKYHYYDFFWKRRGYVLCLCMCNYLLNKIQPEMIN